MSSTRNLPYHGNVCASTDNIPLAGRELGNSDSAVRRLAAEGMEQLAATLDRHVPQPQEGEVPIDVQGERKRLGSAYDELMPLLEAFGKRRRSWPPACETAMRWFACLSCERWKI